MDLEIIEFLLTDEGRLLLDHAKTLQGSVLSKVTALRKHYPAKLASAAFELLELRKRAAMKFSRSAEMFFTREALEQSTGEVVSRYRAERYTPGSHVLDLACGIGGDTIGLASRCIVTAVDSDPIRLAMAQRNLEVYGLSDRVHFVCADVTQFVLDADAAFLDPSRRASGKRVVDLSQLSPPLGFIHHLISEIPNCGIKLSPATDYPQLESLGGEIEFISESGECKEAAVWFGEFNTVSRRATILPEKVSLAWEPAECVPVRPPGRYLYEPDPCVIRAHLVEQLAVGIGASRIDEQIAYLTSENLATTPYAKAYEIVESMPFNLKAIQKRLRQLDVGRVVVKKRGVPFEPREMEQRLKGVGKKELVLILTRIGKKPWAVICNAL